MTRFHGTTDVKHTWYGFFWMEVELEFDAPCVSLMWTRTCNIAKLSWGAGGSGLSMVEQKPSILSMRPNGDKKNLLLALYTPRPPQSFLSLLSTFRVTKSSHESSPCLLLFCYIRFPTECWFTHQFQLLLFLIMTRITVIITKLWQRAGWQLTAFHGLVRAQTEFAGSKPVSVFLQVCEWVCVCVLLVMAVSMLIKCLTGIVFLLST